MTERKQTKSMAVGDIIASIRDGGDLQTLAPIMRILVERLQKEDYEPESLLEVARYDSALAFRLLRTANIDADFPGFILDLERAVARIGLKTARNLAFSVGFTDSGNPSEGHPGLYSALQQIWERSLYQAIGARLIAEELKRDNPETYHLFGLISSIGVNFLLCQFPKRYLPVFDHWHTVGGDLTHYEKDALGVDHTIVGEHLARTWNLGPVVEGVILGYYPDGVIGGSRPDLDVIAFAHLAAGVFFETGYSSAIETVNKFGKERLDLEAKQLDLLLQRIAIEADKVSDRLIAGRSAVNTLDLLRSINLELGRATLSYDQLVRELRKTMYQAVALREKLEDANVKLREVANVDPLTQIYNRRFFEEFLKWNFDRASRYGTNLGCLMVDIDHFKRVNDEYGHLTGDRVLHGVAEILRNNLRSTDVIARYGGEEFVVMLPESTPHAVHFTAGKLHQAVSKTSFPTDTGEISITVSIGHCTYNKVRFPEMRSPEELVDLADQHMYQAKKNNRDQIWPPEEESDP